MCNCCDVGSDGRQASGGDFFAAPSVPVAYRQYLEPVVFEPWAERLVELVGISPGGTVLDVASGTGTVARAAARRAGSGGRVIATDLSQAMLDQLPRESTSSGSPVVDSAAARIETRQCPATELSVDDRSVDVALCQQGLPFVPDKKAAAAEMRRVLRPGGRLGVAVWLSTPRLEPFIHYGDALAAHGVPEPFPGAYDSTPLTMTEDEMREVLASGGFTGVQITTDSLEVDWPEADWAAAAMAGTPYGPVVASLDPALRGEVVDDVRARMASADGSAARHRTTSLLAVARVV